MKLCYIYWTILSKDEAKSELMIRVLRNQTVLFLQILVCEDYDLYLYV